MYGLTTHKMIRSHMRNNEVTLLAYMRKHNGTDAVGLGKAWFNALDRLQAAGRVVYRNGRYHAHKGAGPVTPAVW
jgi:hypothetical protein